MKPWNNAYRREAETIAASVIGERGLLWKATEIERGRRPQDEAVAIAMRALMVARGEFEVPNVSYSSRYDFHKRWSSTRE